MAPGTFIQTGPFGIRGKLLNLLEDDLSNRFQRVLLNGQESSWLPIKAEVPQGSILGPLLFLIYINDLPDGLNSIAKLFSDDTFLFSIVHDPNEPAKYLNLDLSVISQWAYQWKMFFNPGPKKLAQEVIFSTKKNEEAHPSVFYDKVEVSRTDSQKHLGLVFDYKLTFNKNIKDKLNKAYFGVGKIKRLRNILPRDSLVTIYKSFIRPHLDYGDVIHDQPNNDSFSDKIEPLQYKACLAVTGAIQKTSRECLYNKLGLESLSSRRWCRKLCAIYKLLSPQCPKYLFNIMPPSERCYTRKKQRPFFNRRTDCFKYSFFSNSLSEWSQLAPEIQNLGPIVVFKSKLLSFIRPSKRSIFNVNNPEGVKYLTRLHLRFNHLNERKFRLGFLDTSNPLCN